MEYPEVTVWVTSCGRLQYLKGTVESWIKQCTYPNYKMVIIESQMTEISKKFFAIEHIHEKETEIYLKHLPDKFPNVKFEITIQLHKILGQVYNQLLESTGDYFINIEDDLETICDPKDQLIDGITLLDKDSKLLGIRTDLRDETVYENCPRFPVTKEIDGIKYVIWKDWCSGGAQIMDARKVREIGSYIDDHAPEQYIQTEHNQSAKMRNAQMYVGISLKYWGFITFLGTFGIQGGNRQYSVDAYEDLRQYGWYGDGKYRKTRKRSSADFMIERIDNGRP